MCACVQHLKMASYATDSNRAELRTVLLTGMTMKTLSGCKAPRCDKHQFHDKMTVGT